MKVWSAKIDSYSWETLEEQIAIKVRFINERYNERELMNAEIECLSSDNSYFFLGSCYEKILKHLDIERDDISYLSTKT